MDASTPASTDERSKLPFRVTARVYACVPEFDLVYVRTADEMQYALGPDTPGIRLKELREGQLVDCEVSAGIPRVTFATVVA